MVEGLFVGLNSSLIFNRVMNDHKANEPIRALGCGIGGITMGRISNKKWCEYTEIKHTARGEVVPMFPDNIKEAAYEAFFEVSNSWGSVFGANLREAVYCEWWNIARQMLDVKPDCKSKDRALTIISDLEHMSKGGDK